jgi:hypothetical protein
MSKASPVSRGGFLLRVLQHFPGSRWHSNNKAKNEPKKQVRAVDRRVDANHRCRLCSLRFHIWMHLTPRLANSPCFFRGQGGIVKRKSLDAKSVEAL